MEILETFLDSFVNLAMLLFEYIGVGVITFAGIQGFVNYVRRSPDTRLILAKGLAMGLEFKLGSEILRTVIVRNLQEIGVVAGIIVLRAALTFLIHWEIKNEEKEGHERGKAEAAASAAAPVTEQAGTAMEIQAAKAEPMVEVSVTAENAEAKPTAQVNETAEAEPEATVAEEEAAEAGADTQTCAGQKVEATSK